MESIGNNGPVNYIGIKDIPVVLHASDTIFIDISNSDSDHLIRKFQLAACPSLGEILRLYVVPNILDTTDDALRDSLVGFALKHFTSLSLQSKDILSRTAIVPVNTVKTTLKRPMDTVALDLMKFFFPDEYRTPVPEFYNRYHEELTLLRMTTKVSKEFALERIQAYSQSDRPPNEVGEKSKGLLKGFFPTNDMKFPQEFINMKWLPAQSPGGVGEPKLYSAEQCRDQSFEPLLKYAMPLMKFKVSNSWRVAMGWEKPLQKPQLLAQLDGALGAKDNTALKHLIDTIIKGKPNYYDCITELQEREWIPDPAEAKYYRPSDIFFNNFSPLSPYLGTVAPKFKKSDYNGFLVKLGVNKEPSFSQVSIHPNKKPQPSSFEEVRKLINSVFATVGRTPRQTCGKGDFDWE